MEMQMSETNVPVPWGHIAVKIWGDQQLPAVLVVHGIQDNAGAMDGLLRLLPPTFCYYAIDLPGHGRSSHWPAYAPIHAVDQLLAFKAVTQHFGHDTYVLLGHSWGGQLALLYAIVYPETVRQLIMLDTLFLLPITSGNFKSAMRKMHEKYFAAMERAKQPPPEYTRDEAVHRLMHQRAYDHIPQTSAEDIFARCMRPTARSKKFTLTTDQRLKFTVSMMTDFTYICTLLDTLPLQCPVLILLATNSFLHVYYMTNIYEKLKAMPNVRIVQVSGSHDVHMNHPQRLVGDITSFLTMPSTYRHKL